MKRLLICLLTLLWFPAPAVHARDAKVYFDLASKSSTAKKKIEYFSKALELDPNLISALCYRAEAYRRSGQNEKAIGDSTEAIHLAREPRILADAYITRAKVYRELGLQDKAFADIRAALLKDPKTYFYRYVSSYASLEEMRGAGLIGIIVLAFVLIFKLRFKAPKKDE